MTEVSSHGCSSVYSGEISISQSICIEVPYPSTSSYSLQEIKDFADVFDEDSDDDVEQLGDHAPPSPTAAAPSQPAHSGANLNIQQLAERKRKQMVRLCPFRNHRPVLAVTRVDIALAPLPPVGIHQM